MEPPITAPKKIQNASIEADMQTGEVDFHQAMFGAGCGRLIGVLTGATLVASGGVAALVVGSFAGLVTGTVAGGFPR